MLADVFAVTDRNWRGIGVIPQSGWRLSARTAILTPTIRFDVQAIHTQESPLCHSGEVLQGMLKPNQCPAFGKECTPRNAAGGHDGIQRRRVRGVLSIRGDTKVVDKGHGDGVYINTSGVGVIPEGVNIGPHRAQPGDVVILSGTIGDHGMAVMSVREGLAFETTIESDTAALNHLVAAMLAVTNDIHVLRDPTRGGVASTLNEIAQSSQVGIVLDERKLPVKTAVRSACELLGMDPLFVANEGKLLAIVPAAAAEAVLAAMQAHPLGQEAAVIGQVVAQHPGMLVAKTGIGATRVVAMQIGEQLPRIC
jgi:hydrogenase expression/formation protein HypE